VGQPLRSATCHAESEVVDSIPSVGASYKLPTAFLTFFPQSSYFPVALMTSTYYAGTMIENWLLEICFNQRSKPFRYGPFFRRLRDGLRDVSSALGNYRKLDPTLLEPLFSD